MVNNPGGGIVYFQVKDGEIYRGTFRKELGGYVENRGRDVVSYNFHISDPHGSRIVSKRIMLSGSLFAETTPIEQTLIAGRGLYSILGTDQIECGFSTRDKERLLGANGIDKSQERPLLLRYMRDRFNSFWEEPPNLLEILSVSMAEAEAVIENLGFWVNRRLLVWPDRLDYHELKSKPEQYLGMDIIINGEKINEIDRELEQFRSSTGRKLVVDLENHHHYKIVDIDTKLQNGFAFVIMPFNESEFNQSIMDDAFKPVVADVLNVPCIRSDSEKVTHFLENLIYTYIVRSDVVIADLSIQNPNVIFEFGLALALEKEVIAVFDNKYRAKGKPAFDYEHYGTLFYNDYEHLKTQLRKKLPAFRK
ncbi:MAG: hypothetical protein GYA46_13085 [candidate division Zixibacteria bacterium]|nr:hypothetical protein [candidate division Zixibacteria bacterium]